METEAGIRHISSDSRKSRLDGLEKGVLEVVLVSVVHVSQVFLHLPVVQVRAVQLVEGGVAGRQSRL